MTDITRSQVQELVKKLPETKLTLAYDLLVELVENKTEPSGHLDISKLPIEARRRLLAEQAEALMTHYAETVSERSEWQAGDFNGDY